MEILLRLDASQTSLSPQSSQSKEWWIYHQSQLNKQKYRSSIYRSFLPIIQDMKQNGLGLLLRGKTDSETMYWKYALGSAFLKLFPSSQMPKSAYFSSSTFPIGPSGVGQRYFGEKQKASHVCFGAQNAPEKSQTEKRCESWPTSEHQGGLGLPVRSVLLRQ